MKACQQGFNPEYHEDAPTMEELGRMEGYAVLEFGTPWCGHCKAAASPVEAVLSGRGLSHIKIFDGKGKALGRSFAVKLWPTLVLVKSGAEIARLVRPVRAEEIHELLSKMEQ
jgi:thioredoxin 1